MFTSSQIKGNCLVGIDHPGKQILQILPCQDLCFHPTNFNSTLHDLFKQINKRKNAFPCWFYRISPPYLTISPSGLSVRLLLEERTKNTSEFQWEQNYWPIETLSGQQLCIFKPPCFTAYKWERGGFISIKLPKLLYKPKKTTILYLYLPGFSTKV